MRHCRSNNEGTPEQLATHVIHIWIRETYVKNENTCSNHGWRVCRDSGLCLHAPFEVLSKYRKWCYRIAIA